MLSSVLSFGVTSLERIARGAVRPRETSEASQHPLKAYPRLQTLLNEAERTGELAAERRRLVRSRLVA